MLRVAQRTVFTDHADRLAHGVRFRRKAEGDGNGDQHRHGERACEIAGEHQTPVPQDAGDRDAGPFVEPGEGGEDEYSGQQVESQQIQHAEADRKQDRADDRRASLHIDGDRECGSECENRACHE